MELSKEYIEITNQIKGYIYATGMMSWDIETAFSEAAVPEISSAISMLSRKNLDLLFSDQLYHEIEQIIKNGEGEHRDIAVSLKKAIDRDKIIPKDLIIKKRELTSKLTGIWMKAKKENDFKTFAPHLKELVDVQKEIIKHCETEQIKGYDVLLNRYEEGILTNEITAFFDELKAGIVPLIHQISKLKLDVPKLEGNFSINSQRDLANELLTYIGFDLTRGRIGETEHPFCLGLTDNDVRIATHYYENDLFSGIFSILHEGGHGIYEQNGSEIIRESLQRGGSSMSIHESQSRFYENMIGRSKAFWKPIYANLQSKFNQLENIDLDTFYLMINESKPSLIRIEADELTYSLHIMIRFEIEKMIFNENIEIEDLPRIWNEKIKEYLGLEVPNDGVGVLQDTHWASGLFGYFPSYALGSANAAQMYHVMKKDLDIESLLLNSDLEPIKQWLVKRIHQFGATKTSAELMKIATNELPNAKYFIDYLVKKYSDIYKIK